MASSLRRAIAYILINRRFSALLSHFASDLGLVKLAFISFACPRHSLATRILTASRFFDALLSLSTTALFRRCFSGSSPPPPQ